MVDNSIFHCRVGVIKKKHGDKGFDRLNKIFGIIMIGFGVIVFAKMIFER